MRFAPMWRKIVLNNVNIKQSLKVEVSDRTCISQHSSSVSLIEDGEVLTLQFDGLPVEKLSEIIEKLQTIEREAVDRQLKKLKKYNSSVQLPLLPTLPPQYRSAEFS
jgi:hypothetical protein